MQTPLLIYVCFELRYLVSLVASSLHNYNTQRDSDPISLSMAFCLLKN